MEVSSTNVMATVDNLGAIHRRMELYEKIKIARKAKRLSQRELGEIVGISQVAIKKIEAGTTKDPRKLVHILQALDLPLTDIKTTARLISPPALPANENPLIGESNLPVYSSEEGERESMVISSKPINYVGRPAPLANVKDAYALIIIGDLMSPEFREGDTALVNPHLPPLAGEACIFYGIAGEAGTPIVVRTFVKKTATHWHVSQWNPKKAFALSRKDWPKCHRVIGKFSRH